MNRHGAPGIDGESIEQFESELELRLQDICERLKAASTKLHRCVVILAL